MRTAAPSGRLAGSNGESPPHRPPERRAFPCLGRDFPPEDASLVQSERPVRTPDELSTVRALGRAAAAVLFLPAILGRGSPRHGRRPSTEREFESVSRVADELARSADVEGVARMLLDEFAELFDVGFVALSFISD